MMALLSIIFVMVDKEKPMEISPPSSPHAKKFKTFKKPANKSLTALKELLETLKEEGEILSFSCQHLLACPELKGKGQCVAYRVDISEDLYFLLEWDTRHCFTPLHYNKWSKETAQRIHKHARATTEAKVRWCDQMNIPMLRISHDVKTDRYRAIVHGFIDQLLINGIKIQCIGTAYEKYGCIVASDKSSAISGISVDLG